MYGDKGWLKKNINGDIFCCYFGQHFREKYKKKNVVAGKEKVMKRNLNSCKGFVSH